MHVFTPAQRDAPTNMINNAIAVGAAHKLRFAQDLILYNLDALRGARGLRRRGAPQTWQEDPVWQPTREIVEQLTAIRDWGEPCSPPTSSSSRSSASCSAAGFVMQIAARTATSSPRRSSAPASPTRRASCAARGRCSGCWPTTRRTAPQNKATHAGLARRRGRRAPRRGAQLQPIWSQLGREGRALRGLLRALAPGASTTLLGDIGLETPKELKA